jgi:hypothetical protein
MSTALDRRYPSIEGEWEFEFEAEAEAEWEGEAENEWEDEGEQFVNPVRRIYRDAELMAHLSSRAAEAETESEAEAFIGALVPIAAQLIPRAATLVARNAPALIRGATAISRRLRSRQGTRQLVRALPVVVQRTAQSLADQAAAGRTITADGAVRTLATMTNRVLADPSSRRRAVSAVKVFDRRWHQHCRPAPAPRRPRAGLPPRLSAGGPAYRIPGSRSLPRPRPQPRRRVRRRA